MRAGLLLLICVGLTACMPPESGVGNTPGGAPASAPVMPSVRALFPADLDARGIPDVIPHPSLQRIVIQAPPNTAVRVSRGMSDLPATVTSVTVGENLAIHEITLAEPIGTEPVTVRAGDYVLAIVPDAEQGVALSPEIRPRTEGAITDDLASPRGALFKSAEDVALLIGGALPSLTSGVVLRSGDGAPISLNLSLRRLGIVATPVAPLRPDTVYRIDFGGDTGPYAGGAATPPFHVRCFGEPGRHAVKLLQADIRRSGEPELLCLFSDGTVTAMHSVDRAAEVVLPGGGGLALDFAVGDFNGNGAPDIAVLIRDNGESRLVVMSNRTRAEGMRFEVASEVLALDAPIALCAADFNRDGRDNIGVLDAFGDVLVRYPGKPAAMFSVFESRTLVTALLAADFTGNSRPDLFVLAADGRGRIVQSTNGGYFDPDRAVLLEVPRAQRVAAAELDGDRMADLVFTGHHRSIDVRLGASRELLAFVPVAYERRRLAGHVLCADVNGNTRCDLVAVLEDENGVSIELALYLNSTDADGTPDAILDLGTSLVIRDMQFWRQHLMIASDAGLLMLGVDSESLPPSIDSKVRFVEAYNPVPRIPAPLASAIADFNDNGKADLATLDRDGRLHIWLAGDEGEPFTPSGDPIELGGQGKLLAVDFERNNYPGVLFIPDNPNLRPRLLRNNRDGTFSDDLAFLPPPPSTLRGAPALGDFDRDGDLDVFWPSPLGRLQFNEGLAGWRDSKVPLEVRDPYGLRLQFSGELCCADFTRNGINDIVAVMQPGENIGPQYLVLWAGTGSSDDETPPFIPALTVELPGRFFGLSPADFTGDGRLDLALGYAPEGQPARLTLLRLRSDLTFEIIDGAPASKGELLDLAMDDLDRSGNLDVIATERVNGRIVVTLWINSGNGRFFEADEAQQSLTAALGGFQAVNLSLADFTGDGRPDLLAIDADGNVVIVRTTLP